MTYLQWLIHRKSKARKAHKEAVKADMKCYREGTQDDDVIYNRKTTEAELHVWSTVYQEYKHRVQKSAVKRIKL